MACTVCGLGNGRTLLLCDGSNAEGMPCKSEWCFACAGVTSKPKGEWFCKTGDCSGKRSTAVESTPPRAKSSRSVSTASPALRDKILLAVKPFQQLPTFPGASSSGGESKSFSDGITSALLLLTDRIDSMHKDMVSLDALSAAKAELLAQFEAHMKKLESKQAELELANQELRKRVDVLEAKLQSLPASSYLAHRRITFLGFEN